MDSSTFTTATSETSIKSVTQSSGSIVTRNWTPSRTPNSQVRTFLFSGNWTSTGKSGELIVYTNPTALNGPIPLPHVLITGSDTNAYSIDVMKYIGSTYMRNYGMNGLVMIQVIILYLDVTSCVILI